MTGSSGVVLSNLAYLLGAVVLAIIGGLVVWLHYRQPKSVDANVESFSRGLRALAPDASGPGPRRAPAVEASGGLRIQPRPAVAAPDAGERPETADDGPAAAADTAGRPGPPPPSPGQPEPVAVDLSRQETPDQATPGEGVGERAEAETG